jgi:predicted transcriptional regulator
MHQGYGMQISSDEKLLYEIEVFLRETGMSKSAFGRAVCGDPRMVPLIIKGRSVTLRTYDRIQAFMRNTRRFAHPKRRKR